MVLQFTPTMEATPTVPVEVRGRYLWRGEKRFLVRGVVYQANNNDDFSLAGRDLLKDESLAQRQHDLGLFKELGINAIYICKSGIGSVAAHWYAADREDAIDPTKDHTRVMKMLEDAGIYVILSLSSIHRCIRRTDPMASYTPETIDHFFRNIDAMARFPNTLGCLIADHLINDTHTEITAPVITAVVRDLKRYMSLKHRAAGQRILPVGLGGGEYRDNLKVVNYLTAGDESSRIDFWTCTGYNREHNRDSFVDLAETYRATPIPIFLSEYGANTNLPRTFPETTALHSPPATTVLSGGCVYEFWQSDNNYGLVLLELHNPKIPIGEFGNRSCRRAEDAVAEIRQTDAGTLYVFKDFVNYKQRLAETRDIVASADEAPERVEGAENWKDSLFGHKPSDGVVPESCVDWEGVERGVGSG